jgi:hypothetical protein
LAPPHHLLTSERLLLFISTYIAGAVSNGLWNPEKDEYIPLAAARLSQQNKADNFNEYCVSSVELFNKGSNFRARRMLMKAFSLVPTLIDNQMPTIMERILNVLIYLIGQNQPDIADLLRNYVKDVTISSPPQGHPLRHIYAYLAATDLKTLHQLISQAWQCSADSFARNLSPTATTTSARKPTWQIPYTANNTP